MKILTFSPKVLEGYKSRAFQIRMAGRQQPGRGAGSEMRRVNVDLMSLTYGALVYQLVKDYENDAEVNHQLEKIGSNIGERLVEDFLARTGQGRCRSFRDTVDTICKAAFKQYLGLQSVESTGWDSSNTECSIIMKENPLADFVELPEKHQSLCYSNIIVGIIKGALRAVHQEVQCHFAQDVLLGHPITEIKLKFIRIIQDTIPTGEED